MAKQIKKTKEFTQRFAKYYDELKWLYCELYHNDMQAFQFLCDSLYSYYKERKPSLKNLDRIREKNPDWYKNNNLLGMMLYTQAFAGNLQGVKEKLDYLESSGINYIHLMRLLQSPPGRSDGGYAVSDFRTVQPSLGTMKELSELTEECHKRGISCCLDFVMNHTSEDHIWAQSARQGNPIDRARYFFYDNWEIPNQYEQTVPQVFPTTAPGNFTWLPDCQQVVMTTFYPYQWDLNYANPMVFNDMVGNMLFLANQGIDILRLDAVPYIWKELGTDCRNLPQVHTLVRMMRIISEIVCPSVLLLGEVVMEPVKVVPYFGTVEKPECHMLYNVTTMASTWHTVATQDTRLLKSQLNQINQLPKDYVFLNYLRCHDDIGWGLDYEYLKNFSVQEVPHKAYLNAYFTGKLEGSPSRGELYNDDPRLGDARLCGTTASLCGLESALYEQDAEKIDTAVRKILMLHAYMLSQSGIPVIYSGDEIGQLNDYTYHNDPEKWEDSRYIHRGNFNWDFETFRHKKNTSQHNIFYGLRHLEELRAKNSVFSSKAKVHLLPLWQNQILGIHREDENQSYISYFNFGDFKTTCEYFGTESMYDLETGKPFKGDTVELEPFGYRLFLENKTI